MKKQIYYGAYKKPDNRNYPTQYETLKNSQIHHYGRVKISDDKLKEYEERSKQKSKNIIRNIMIKIRN